MGGRIALGRGAMWILLRAVAVVKRVVSYFVTLTTTFREVTTISSFFFASTSSIW